MKYELKNGLPENFVYAASEVVSYRAEFKQEEDGLVNSRFVALNPEEKYKDYEYISAVAKEMVELPVVLKTECSFDAYGAPLILFAESMEERAGGRFVYGKHYEAVLWEKGINLWQLDPDGEGKQQVTNLCRAAAPFERGKTTELVVRLERDGFTAQAGELVAKGVCSLPEKMYVGFTACEGINHFRSFSIEKD